jgi:hypothetical protein
MNGERFGGRTRGRTSSEDALAIAESLRSEPPGSQQSNADVLEKELDVNRAAILLAAVATGLLGLGSEFALPAAAVQSANHAQTTGPARCPSASGHEIVRTIPLPREIEVEIDGCRERDALDREWKSAGRW